MTSVEWARQFQRRNQKWCERRKRLAQDLLVFCGGPLIALDKATSADQKRLLLRRIKFATFRLSVFYHPEAIELFRTLLGKPWIVHPHITARALRHYRAGEILREGLSSPFTLVRAKCAQELGYFTDDSARPQLWRMVEHGQNHIERLAATEGLLRIGRFTGAEKVTLLRCVREERQPCVLKNLLLMLPQAKLPGWETAAEEALRRLPHQVVFDALAWAKAHQHGNVLALADVEPPYTRQTHYPDFELDTSYFDASG
jgi:hypothetical protein